MTNNNVLHGHWRHGESESPEYKSWEMMIQRCTNPNYSAFRYYGHRGITICERWLDFTNFLSDMGKRPTSKHTLGRKDNDGNYEPNNCEWQTRAQQSQNSRRTKLTMVEAREIRMLYNRGYTHRELAKEFGVRHSTIGRITREEGWKE